jgi:FAD/FMN-containing dehydrogenase/Fe-S oxidoreductase
VSDKDRNGRLERRLRAAVEGEVLFGRFDRGRYATDASIYQMFPLGVVVPRRFADVEAVRAVAAEEGVPVLPRGGGTSQCGQTVNEAVVVDFSKHLNNVISFDAEAATAVVQPGLVLDELNRAIRSTGLWFPVDISTGSRATLGGMTANNSCGSRSIRYGMMRDNVLAVDALLADGTKARFAKLNRAEALTSNEERGFAALARDLLQLGAREAEEIRLRFPNVPRRVGGYNLDALAPNGPANDLSALLVGSEGTLAISERITVKLAPVLREKVLGICHFPTFREAMDAAQYLVRLGPTAVELMDKTMIALSREIAMFRPVVDRFVRGEPAALLMVEFAEADNTENLRRLRELHDVMADLGFRWGDPGKREGGVVDATDPAFVGQIFEVRKQGLNIMMSMKSDGKPISFIEDCCVRLPDLADFTDKLTAIFHKHGTDGTWYAHASVGTLHVRPVINLKLDTGAKAMRAIAEEAFDLVATYRGAHSGEHGDGIVRSEFHEKMFGGRIVAAFEEVKARMDPEGLLNPGKIVHAPKMDNRDLFRYPPGYRVAPLDTAFDWSAYTGEGRGFQGAVEMCNNNGACRKLVDGVMCPSYRVTRNERDLVRGRANSLRLAISGQVGPDALASDEMMETLKTCVSCKGCRRECPTGIDMAKMKIEVLRQRVRRNGLKMRDRLVAHLPRYGPYASRVPFLMNLRDRLPGLPQLSERLVGLAAERSLPQWAARPFADTNRAGLEGAEVVLFADTFNRYFEPEVLEAADGVLGRTGLRVGHATPENDGRPLCCGRTYLSVGLVDEARVEMRRTAAVLRRAIDSGATVVGLEPSCVMTFRDEAPALLGDEWPAHYGEGVQMLQEWLIARHRAGKLGLNFAPVPGRALLHGHCHQKAFNTLGAVQSALALIPELKVETVASSCCGMAGAFGYQAETAEASRAMGELSLLPAVRKAPEDTIVLADGTSCRHQIADGAQRRAMHSVELLHRSVTEVAG